MWLCLIIFENIGEDLFFFCDDNEYCKFVNSSVLIVLKMWIFLKRLIYDIFFVRLKIIFFKGKKILFKVFWKDI